MQPMIWGYKFTREIARRMPHFRGEPGVLQPGFAAGGPASVMEHAEGPVPFDAPRIVYSEEDDRVVEAFAREKGACLPFSVPPYDIGSPVCLSFVFCDGSRCSGHCLALCELLSPLRSTRPR